MSAIPTKNLLAEGKQTPATIANLPKNVVVSEAAAAPVQPQELQALLAELAAAKAALADTAHQLEVTKSKLPVDDYITLRGTSPTFTVIIEGKRYLFVNNLFTTRDRLLANQILATYPTNVTEVKEDESIPLHITEIGKAV